MRSMLVDNYAASYMPVCACLLRFGLDIYYRFEIRMYIYTSYYINIRYLKFFAVFILVLINNNHDTYSQTADCAGFIEKSI